MITRQDKSIFILSCVLVLLIYIMFLLLKLCPWYVPASPNSAPIPSLEATSKTSSWAVGRLATLMAASLETFEIDFNSTCLNSYWNCLQVHKRALVSYTSSHNNEVLVFKSRNTNAFRTSLHSLDSLSHTGRVAFLSICTARSNVYRIWARNVWEYIHKRQRWSDTPCYPCLMPLKGYFSSFVTLVE